MIEPCLDILPSAQQLIWKKLKAFSAMGFVLYGGTAIALRYGHRESVDFDFFSNVPFDSEELIGEIDFLKTGLVIQEEKNTLSLLLSPIKENPEKTVKISFFGGLRFGRVGKPEITLDQVLYLASTEDLLAHKLKVILQRVELKDYLDIVVLLKNGVSLERGLAFAQILFGNNFQPSECLKALVYFQGGDLETLSFSDKKFLVGSVSNLGLLPKVNLLSNKITLDVE